MKENMVPNEFRYRIVISYLQLHEVIHITVPARLLVITLAYAVAILGFIAIAFGETSMTTDGLVKILLIPTLVSGCIWVVDKSGERLLHGLPERLYLKYARKKQQEKK